MKEERGSADVQSTSLPLTLLLLAIGAVALVLIGRDFPLSNWAALVQAWPQFTQGWQAHNLSLQIPFWLRLLQSIFLILAWVTLLFISYTTLFSSLSPRDEMRGGTGEIERVLGKEHAPAREHFVGKEHSSAFQSGWGRKNRP